MKHKAAICLSLMSVLSYSAIGDEIYRCDHAGETVFQSEACGEEQDGVSEIQIDKRDKRDDGDTKQISSSEQKKNGEKCQFYLDRLQIIQNKYDHAWQRNNRNIDTYEFNLRWAERDVQNSCKQSKQR